MANNISNSVLAQAEHTIEQNLQPAIQQDYQKIVVAGLHILLDKGAGGFMAKLANSEDPIKDCGQNAAALVMIMRKEAKGVMSMSAAIPAGATLMIHGLDFVSRSKIAKVGAAELASAARVYTNTMFAKLGITPAMLHQLVAKAHGVTQNPQAMASLGQQSSAPQAPMKPASLLNGAA